MERPEDHKFNRFNKGGGRGETDVLRQQAAGQDMEVGGQGPILTTLCSAPNYVWIKNKTKQNTTMAMRTVS